MGDKKEYLTKEKHQELQSELDNLKKVKRKEVAENLEYAKSLGDLSENAEYHEARELQANIEDRISKLELILKSAIIVSDRHTDTVGIGSTVVVKRDKNDQTSTFTIVGSEEVDVKSGKLSMNSPLGGALLGKKKGENFSFTAPSGMVNYKIVDIK